MNEITGSKADVTIQGISEVVPEGEEGGISTTGEIEGEEAEANLTWLWIVIIIVVLVVLGGLFKSKKKK